jgi:hypothetical protein
MLFVMSLRKILPDASSLVLGLAGALFATHPIHTDAVCSIVGRAEVLSGLFVLLSFLVYASAVPKANSTSFSYLKIVVSILLAGTALFCKEQGITVIAVNAVYDFSVVCELDVISFLSVLFGKQASPPKPPVEDASAKDTKKASTEPSKEKSRFSPQVQAFLKRMAVLVVGLALIVILRLRCGAQERLPDKGTNRLSIVYRDMFSLSFFLLKKKSHRLEGG